MLESHQCYRPDLTGITKPEQYPVSGPQVVQKRGSNVEIDIPRSFVRSTKLPSSPIMNFSPRLMVWADVPTL